MRATLDEHGAFIERKVVRPEIVTTLRAHFTQGSGRPGARSFDLAHDIVDLIGPSGELGTLAHRATGMDMKPVRVLLFDKTAESNWAIPWHQDRTIAVRERVDVEGYGPWTTKDGVIHVEPPVSLLKGMLTLRLFVDDCNENSGPLLIAIGSHRNGRLPAARIGAVAAQSEIFVCTGQSGDALVMKTLAVHSSKASSAPTHRRVLHVDYSASVLSLPLDWKLH